LSGDYLSGLTFSNTSVPLDYSVDDTGKAIVTFEVGGYPGDVDTFWENVRQGEIEGGQTLAEMLDTRTDPIGEPQPQNLPSTINPTEFMLENVMQNNLFLVWIRPSLFSPDAPGSGFIHFLRNVIAPNTTFVVFLTIEPPLDTIPLNEAGTTSTPGFGEESERFQGPSPLEDVVSYNEELDTFEPTYKDVCVLVKMMSGVCR